jgi:hypothetical protein
MRGFRAPGIFCPGLLGIGIAGQWRGNAFAWQADSAAHIEFPDERDKSQELQVTTARAVFPLSMLAHDGDSLPEGEAVGDFWTMIGNDGQNIGKRQYCLNYYKMDCANAFHVKPEISTGLAKVSSAAEFLLMHHWIEAHEKGKLEEQHDWSEYGRLGDIVLAVVVIRNAYNTARRVALVTTDYQYWIQGDPKTAEIVLV